MRTSNAAKLPALPSVSTGNAALDKWVQAVTERLEVREGMRGNPNERAVTVRDMRDAGVSAFTTTSTTPGSVLTVNADGTYSTMTPDAFAESIRSSKLYKDLMKRLDDVTRFDGLPEQVKAVLLTDLAEEAAKRGADIRRLENKLQSTAESLAYTVEEVTAAVEGSVAGVRETVFASASANTATAGKVTQIQARLDDVGGVTIEESMIATADRVDGLEGKYTVKVNAGGAVAGFGLAASENLAGVTTSDFYVQADRFALFPALTFAQEATPSATVIGQTWYTPSTGETKRATATGTGGWALFTPPIPFSVDTTTGTVSINGQLRVTGSGATLEDLASGAVGTSYGLAYAYKRSATNLIAGWAPATNGPGAITWTFASGSITTPATDALLNGWTKAIPTGTDPLYVTVCSAANTTATDDIAATEWAAPVILAQNGTSGLNVATAILYQRNSSATVGPTAQANTVTFTFATGGMTGMSAGWTAAIPSASGGAYLWVTRATASATTATDTLAAGEWSTPVLYTQDGIDGIDGDPGTAVYTGTVYKQAASATAPTGGNFNAVTSVLTAPSGWSVTQPTTTTTPTWASEYTFNAVVGDTTNAGGTWSTPYIDAVAGADGVTQMRLELYLSAASAPTKPTSVLYTVTGNALGAQTGGTAGWSTTKPANPAYPSAVYMTTAVVSTSTPGTQLSVGSWTTPVIVSQNGAPGGTGTRGTIVTKITGAWNATSAAAAVSAIATAAGATPTTPIKGDIVYYTGGANECTVAGSPGTWAAVAAYIDGSLVVTGTISGTQIAATAIDGKTITGATVQTAASGARWVLTGTTYAMQLRGFNSSNYNNIKFDSSDGSMFVSSLSSTTAVHEVRGHSTVKTLDVYNDTSGVALLASGTSGSAVKGTSGSGYGGEFLGNATRPPINIASSVKPTNSTTGGIMIYNVPGVGDRLCYCLGNQWYYLATNTPVP